MTHNERLASLDPQQREAVLATEGPVLILAGAGSGKTRVITHRVAHLVLDRGVPSEQVLAVTFTNKAAEEMRSRVRALLGGGAFHSTLGTFHSLCVRLLRREHAAAALPRDFLIYDETDQLQAVRQAIRELDLSEKLHPPRRILSRISGCKNAGRDPELPGDTASATTFARLAERYRLALERAHALDFDDLLLRTVKLFAEYPEVRERHRRRFRYLLVDEYQDTNRAQYEIVRHLAGEHGNLTVVGDEDQSIYSWRGADIQNILDFERDFPGARVLRLEENYRSSQAILDVASALVAHNRRRKGKVLRAVRPSGDPVRLHQAPDEYQEASWVVGQVASRRPSERAAVLFRTNAQSRLFEEGLRRQGVAYAVVGGVGFYDRKEVKDLVAYLRLVSNAADAVALRRIVNVPPRGVGPRSLEEAERLAAERGLTLWDALGAVADEGLLPGRAASPIRRFRELVGSLREQAAGLPPSELLKRVLAESGYSAALAEEDTQESQDRLDNLAELLKAAAEYEGREDEPTLAGFLDSVSLISDVDVVRGDAPVVLMTLHAAKGLEFDSVFLVGLEEGLVPHARSLEDDDALEEERRLCYVGMTRARERLFLTCAESRQVFGQRRLSERSRFLDELPPDRLRRSGSLLGGEDRAWRPRTGFRREGPRPLVFHRPSPPGAPAEPAGSAAGPTPGGPGAPSAASVRLGGRVRHPLFGVGTVVRREGAGEDLKLTVSFPGLGAKRLVARFAGLEVL